MKLVTAILLIGVSVAHSSPLLSPRQAASVRAVVTPAKIPVVLASRIYGRTQTNYWGLMWSSNVAALTVVNLTNLPTPSVARIRISATEDRAAMARVSLDAASDKITLPGHWVADYPLDAPYHFFQIALKDESASLAWEPSPSEQVSGYKVYSGTNSGAYSQVTDAQTARQWNVENLSPGVTYYFAVTAYDAAGMESQPSNEAVYTAPLVEPQVAVEAR